MIRYWKPLFWIALGIFLLSLGFLVSGSSLLMAPIGGEAQIPLGNVTTALGCMAWAVLPWSVLYRVVNRESRWFPVFDGLSKLALFASILWWPLGRVLSGNWNNSFINRPTASWWFWNTTYCIVGLPLLLLLFFLVFRLFQGKK